MTLLCKNSYLTNISLIQLKQLYLAKGEQSGHGQFRSFVLLDVGSPFPVNLPSNIFPSVFLFLSDWRIKGQGLVFCQTCGYCDRSLAAVTLDFHCSLCGRRPSQARWISDVTLSKIQASCSAIQSPGPQLSSPSLTLSLSRSQVNGVFSELLSALVHQMRPQTTW